MDMTQILQKLKRQRYRTALDWNISFIKQCWWCLHSREASVGQQNWTTDIPLKKRTAGGFTPSHHHYFVTWWLWQILISQILMHSDVQMSRYFSRVVWPHHDFFLIGIHPMQGWTATMRLGVASKKRKLKKDYRIKKICLERTYS